MVGGGASSSPSSPSSTFEFTYEAFLSFRGEDTRYGFTGNLYSALKNRGIHTFIDDEKLGRGKEITPSLITAIERSRTAIVVLSRNYASSSFCLDELVKILDCIKGKGRLVIPVFYDVDPSDVRKRIGTYGEALAAQEDKFKANKHKFNENMERLKKWKIALEEVGGLSGYHFTHGDRTYEYEFIFKIVEQVSRQTRRAALPVVDHPVGIDSQVKKVTSLMDLGSNDVRIVGIHGIGGIGKTTLAVAIYNSIANNFEHSSFELCFLGNIRENSKDDGLRCLQKILLSALFGEKDIVLPSVELGISILKQRLQGKKILLILDDIDQEEQLKALAGNSNWFGPGSRVIITTRDIHLLSRYEDKIAYELEKLNEEDALELLSWKAFKTNNVDPSYMDVLKEVVTYASGLPLALEVIGSHLLEKSIEEWKFALDQYKRSPHEKIQSILKVSFDALHELEKEIFLDIACCLRGYELTYVKEILRAHHSPNSPEFGFVVLVKKSLIRINPNGVVTLHDLVQQMGREIVRKKSPKQLGERCRLWLLGDIVQVLENNMGTDKIEMIHMNFPIFEKVINWDGKAFRDMRSLKTLIIRNVRFSQRAKYLPNSLRVLEWWKYPSPSLPPDFHPEELTILKLSDSSLQSLEFYEKVKFINLSVLNLDGSQSIERIHDVSGAPNLIKLSCSYCKNLVELHESVGFLSKLQILNLRGCKRLSTIPPLELSSLEVLNLSKCLRLQHFPEILGEMENIRRIFMKYTPVKELPASIVRLTQLGLLSMRGCGMLQFPISIITLPHLWCLEFEGSKGLQFPESDRSEDSSNVEKVAVRNCNMTDESFRKVLAYFRNVVILDLSGNNFKFIPESITELRSLLSLTLDDCKQLEDIGGVPPRINLYYARNSTSLNSSSRNMLLNEEVHKGGDKSFHLPGSSIPEWFEHSRKQDSISFWVRNKLPEISLCVVIGPVADFGFGFTILYELIINGNKVSSDFIRGWFGMPIIEDHIVIFDLNRIELKDNLDKVLLKNEWNHVECRFMLRSPREGIVKQTGIHVFKHKSSIEDIRFTNSFLQYEEVNMGDFQINLQQQNNTPAMNSSNDNLNWDSNSITLMPISNARSVQDYGSNTIVVDHPAKAQPNSQVTSFREMLNVQAPNATASWDKVTRGELTQVTSSIMELPTAIEYLKNQTNLARDDIEMEAFFASLEAETSVLPLSNDTTVFSEFANRIPSEETQKALKTLQDFLTKDFSVLLGHDEYNAMKATLYCLTNLPLEDGMSLELRSLIIQVSRSFTHWSWNYTNESKKIEATTAKLLKVDELEKGLEANKIHFREVMCLENELCNEVAYLEERKKELEEQINAIKARISASESARNMAIYRKREIFGEAKMLKVQRDELREQVPHLRNEQELAKKIQANIRAEWSKLGEEFSRSLKF